MSTILTLLNKRKKNNTSSIIVPWYLSGGISAANCIAAYQPMGAASQAASYINLANPGTYDLTDGKPDEPANWDTSSGWRGTDGIASYLKTGLVPTGLLSFAGRIVSPGVSTGAFGQCAVFGGVGTCDNKFHPNYSNVAVWVFVGNKEIYSGPVVSSGTHTFIISSSGKVYIDGSLHSDGGTPSWSGTALELYLMAINAGGTPSSMWNNDAGRMQAIAAYDIPLTATHVAALTAAMGEL